MVQPVMRLEANNIIGIEKAAFRDLFKDMFIETRTFRVPALLVMQLKRIIQLRAVATLLAIVLQPLILKGKLAC